MIKKSQFVTTPSTRELHEEEFVSMQSFDTVDFVDIQGLYTESELQVMKATRDFVSQEFMPIVNSHFRAGTFPLELVPRMGELGFLGANLEGYGCAGMNNVEYGLIMQELERGDSGLRSFSSVQSSLVMYPILTFGSDEQKEKWLPELAAGTKIGCFGLTEPDYGSNPAGLITRAEKKGREYVLNGSKMWITSGGVADVAVVWAKLDGKIRGFLIEKGTPGFSARNIEGKFSLRASITSSLAFEDCRIPEENILPKSDGVKSALMCLTQARYGIAWGAVGSAMACYHEALNYAKERVQFGKPIAGFQLVQKKLADMITDITEMNLLVYRVAQLKDAGKAKHYHVSMAKGNNVSKALRIARVARDILGANGIADEYQCGRHMCNLESVNTYEGTEDIHSLVVGHEITGIPAYS